MANLLVCGILVVLSAAPTFSCYDANGNLQICALNTDQTQCCKCTSGCCTPEENDVCDTAKSILDKLPVWAWGAIGVGGFIFLLLIIIGLCCCCGCCDSCRGQTTSVITGRTAAQGYVPMANPVSAGGAYV